MIAANANDFAVGQDEFERGDVIGGDAVGERVRAAGIFSDVAADGAGFLAGGIGSEVQAGMFDGASEIEIDDAWLHDRALIFDVESRMRFMRVKAMHEPAAARERAAGESGSCAAADDGHVMCCAASATMRETSSVLRGKTTTSGRPFSTEPSYS